jgi:NMD protein affecting ribosome stability and mRNA decay
MSIKKTRICTSCGEEKQASSFYGARIVCKKCVSKDAKINYAKRQKRHTYPEDCVDPREFAWYYGRR